MAILKMNILSKALGMHTNVTICLPTFCLEDMFVEGRKPVEIVPGMKYQTLYLLHGGAGDDSDWLNHSNVVRYANEHKVAVVMPNGYLNRYIDYPGYPQYFTYVTEELPKICQTFFPLSNKREDNFIGGFSMGANGAFKAALLKPEQYAAALIISGALTNKNTGEAAVKGRMPRPYVPMDATDVFDYEMMEKYTEKHLKNEQEIPELFFMWGSEDHSRFLDPKAYEYVKNKGLKAHVDILEGYSHQWELFDEALKKGIERNLPLRHDVIYPKKLMTC